MKGVELTALERLVHELDGAPAVRGGSLVQRVKRVFGSCFGTPASEVHAFSPGSFDLKFGGLIAAKQQGGAALAAAGGGLRGAKKSTVRNFSSLRLSSKLTVPGPKAASRAGPSAGGAGLHLLSKVDVMRLVKFHDLIEDTYRHNPFVFQEYIRSLETAHSQSALRARIVGLFRGHDELVEAFDELVSEPEVCANPAEEQADENAGEQDSEEPSPEAAIAAVVAAAKAPAPGPAAGAPSPHAFLQAVEAALRDDPAALEAFAQTLRDFEAGLATREACIARAQGVLAGHPALAKDFARMINKR